MTATETPSTTVLRPQPVGIFDGPAGLLLVGAGAGDLLGQLAAGQVPDEWPSPAAALGAALGDDVDGALNALGTGAVDAVNRFVLRPTAAHHAAALDAARGDAVLQVVVAAAGFACGLTDQVPDAGALDGELRTLALTVAASAAFERGATTEAMTLLRDACGAAAPVGPALHARTLGSLAEHLHQVAGPSDEVIALYDRAIELLTGTSLAVLRAEMQLQRAVVTHQLGENERHRLVEAIRGYQSALIVLDEVHHPESFAFANMNIALAILALPTTQASDQVRLGVAVQSLRAALRVYTPGTHPQEWSSTQLNLANALQYLPSRHREENLAEAVTLYEALLEVRSPDRDPAGYARVLANQANALAHLGIFVHAVPKYEEARALFWQAGDPDAVGVVDAQLRQIAEHQGATS